MVASKTGKDGNTSVNFYDELAAMPDDFVNASQVQMSMFIPWRLASYTSAEVCKKVYLHLPDVQNAYALSYDLHGFARILPSFGASAPSCCHMPCEWVWDTSPEDKKKKD